MCSRHWRVATGRADLARRQQRHGRHRVERESLQPRCRSGAAHPPGGRPARHLAALESVAPRRRPGPDGARIVRRCPTRRRSQRRCVARSTWPKAAPSTMCRRHRRRRRRHTEDRTARLISSSTQWGFHFPRPTRCDTATCKPGTDPWRRSFYSHPSTTWPSRTPASVMSALAAMACVGRRAQLDVLDVVRAKRSRTPRTTASRRRLPSPGGPWARLGGTQLARREGARCPDVGKLMRMLLPKGSLRSCRMAGRRELATRRLFRVHGQGRRYSRCVRTWREIITTLDQFRLTTVSLERYFNDTFLGQGTGLYGRSRN